MSMNREQMLLIKLAEECAEVTQMASKCLRFGLQEVYKDQELPKTNEQRLVEEFIDLFAVFDVLCNEKFQPESDYVVAPGEEEFSFDDEVVKRKAKLEKYLNYSKSLGIMGND